MLVGASEWERGAVVVKDLAKFEQKEIQVAELTGAAAAAAAAAAVSA